MSEYKLNLTEETEDESRRRTLNELQVFIKAMDYRPLSVTTLDQEQSQNWDQEGEIDYQDAYGRQIVAQITDKETETLIIRNIEGLPVALAALDQAKNWRAIGIDKRLREEIAGMLKMDQIEFEDRDSNNNNQTFN